MARTYIVTIDEEGTYVERPDGTVVHIIGKDVILTDNEGNRKVETYCRPSSAKIQGLYLAGIYS